VSAPIGKGSRFLVLTGPLRGSEFTVSSTAPDDRGWWTLDGPGQSSHYGTTSALEGPDFKRLDNVPAEVDPLFAELAALEAARFKDWCVDTSDDDKRCPSTWCDFVKDEIEHADNVIGIEVENPDGVYREAMMRAAMFALAAVRCIDRAHKPPR
jgi:hypothetical protein